MGCIQSSGKLLMGFQQRDNMIGFEFWKHSGCSMKMRGKGDNGGYRLGGWIKNPGNFLHALLFPKDKPPLVYSVV